MRDREISPVDVVRNALERIEEVNPRLNCFCFTYPEEALEKARLAEQVYSSAEPSGPLLGIPIAIKDLTPTAGKRTTLGSRAYEHWIPKSNAAIVDRLLAAGAILIGKTTTPEFAAFSFTASPLWGTTYNPWNRDFSPGGSSGGSAVAVATGCVPMAEGSDMGGSVRIPAAFCGLAGLKPSFGRIPFDILATQFDALSHFGPLTRTVGDAALFLSVAQGPDERDIQSLSPGLTSPILVDHKVENLKLAISTNFGYYAVDPEVADNLRRTVEVLRRAGVTVEEVELGLSAEINRAYYKHWTVYLAALFSHHLENERGLLDPLTVRQMEEGLSVSAVDFKRTEFVRSELWRTFATLLQKYDAFLCPTTAIAGLPIGATDFDFGHIGDDGRFHGLHMTEHFNLLSQCPAISVPSGWNRHGLPTGIQVVGRRFDDITTLRVAAMIEAVQPWANVRPRI